MRGNAKNLPFTLSNSYLFSNLINERIALLANTCVTIVDSIAIVSLSG